MSTSLTTVALAVFFAIAGTSVGMAESVARLVNEEMVPPTESTAYGTLQLLGDCDSASADSSEVFFNLLQVGVSGPLGAVIASGEFGQNGPVLLELVSGSFWLVAGTLRLAPSFCELLNESSLYIVITSEMYPEGEIRGQIVPVPLPVVHQTWGRIKSGYR